MNVEYLKKHENHIKNLSLLHGLMAELTRLEVNCNNCDDLKEMAKVYEESVKSEEVVVDE